jgi:hypothetical protein
MEFLESAQPERVASPLANRNPVATPSELRLNKHAPVSPRPQRKPWAGNRERFQRIDYSPVRDTSNYPFTW